MNFTAIPFLGWIVGPIVAALYAIPFYVLWHAFNINKFFTFLPEVFVNAGFWDMVGFFLVVSMLKSILLPSFNCSNNCKKD